MLKEEIFFLASLESPKQSLKSANFQTLHFGPSSLRAGHSSCHPATWTSLTFLRPSFKVFPFSSLQEKEAFSEENINSGRRGVSR